MKMATRMQAITMPARAQKLRWEKEKWEPWGLESGLGGVEEDISVDMEAKVWLYKKFVRQLFCSGQERDAMCEMKDKLECLDEIRKRSLSRQ